VGDSVAAARDVSYVTKLRSYKRVLRPSPHVFKSLPTSYRVIHRFCNYRATFIGRFSSEFWQGILEGSLGFGATFVGHFGRAFGGQLIELFL
jgi:hypothetical protein